MADPDHDAVQLAKLGDQEAFAALVRRYQPMVYNLAFACLGDAESAADLTQEAFLRAWRGLTSFAGRAAFSTWLYTIAYRTCQTMAGKRRRDLPLSEVAEPAADQAADPLMAVIRRQEADRLRELLMRLPARVRTALVLFHYHSCSYEEIARITGEPLGTVRTRLHRGRAALQRMLTAEERDKRCSAKKSAPGCRI